MKSKYIVYGDDDCEVTSFRNERDALAFVADPKNLRRYGELSLTCRDANGNHYMWDERTNEWIAHYRE